MNPYLTFVSEYARLKANGRSFPCGGFSAPPRPEIAPDAPRVLIFSPHPDDECVIGGLALRLLREARMNVINVAVTQGSNRPRQPERWRELQAACDYLGFGLVPTQPNGLEKISPKGREQDPANWDRAVGIIANILTQHRPRVLFMPHGLDWNSTHLGTHDLVTEALQRLPAEFACYVVETEFWGQMQSPNLMVESSVADVADLVAATSFHVGEVNRNPYHVLLPAWLMDNVRLGGELVGGQGGAPPDFPFATLYRLSRWSEGTLRKPYDGGRVVPASENPAVLFG
jgi:LmbE family N-acetylglucosaminyl deacetylase